MADLVRVAPPQPALWLPAIAIACLATLWMEPLKWLRALGAKRS